ncbi:uncharacterized protein PHACADRAFT_202195 [Phanerochaete carnosa HHB-10118-sp]|uniref:Uncharacterized protein n=1 Tax=Phanerochaete carnosa (strain HHB-10118-sp) TaxID=650164 RepID=K5VCX4_PHACS|nr:uncharacterized protein PHACADRAFT_202195 [Phanerochaete carnosa HHB-10118-sp]EKM48948.1 hypothetical protein PHACADRAFT_202195 [Phanerochaete carnosa HHB-10118-sp]
MRKNTKLKRFWTHASIADSSNISSNGKNTDKVNKWIPAKDVHAKEHQTPQLL